jgi:hypothetical protein
VPEPGDGTRIKAAVRRRKAESSPILFRSGLMRNQS